MVAVLLVLAGNGAAVFLLTRGDGEPGPEAAAPATTAPGSPAPTGVPAPAGEPPATTVPSTPLERTVAELSAFVASQRGLEFLRPVQVRLLDDEPFVERLLDDSEEQREDTDKNENLLRALHLIEPDVDLFDTFNAFYTQAVLGFYDPETDELVVRGRELTPYVRVTLAHELEHALDDQHFELNRPEVDDADDESSLAFTSLIEGVSLTVEAAYEDTLSPDEQEAATTEAGEFASRAGASTIPPIVTQLVQFPYLAGPDFLAALLEDGREARVDAAFRAPPTTSEEILHPEVYLRGDEPLSVPPPAADGAVVDEGTYGQWALFVTLERFIDADVASRAADGWGGDRYVVWDDGGRSCVRMAYAMDSPADLAELDAAWRQWAPRHGNATVTTSAEQVAVTACG